MPEQIRTHLSMRIGGCRYLIITFFTIHINTILTHVVMYRKGMHELSLYINLLKSRLHPVTVHLGSHSRSPAEVSTLCLSSTTLGDLASLVGIEMWTSGGWKAQHDICVIKCLDIALDIDDPNISIQFIFVIAICVRCSGILVVHFTFCESKWNIWNVLRYVLWLMATLQSSLQSSWQAMMMTMMMARLQGHKDLKGSWMAFIVFIWSYCLRMGR